MTRAVALCLMLLATQFSAGGQTPMPLALQTMPDGYHLQEYDDCGAPDRQPHIVQTTSHTYSTAEVDADEKVRSVAWGWKQVDAQYEGLDPSIDYVLAVTYANEAFNHRVQSLWAGDLQIHGPHPLPKGGFERLLFRVPREAVREGRLSLQFRLEAQVNVVVSVVELWAPLPPKTVVHLCDLSGLVADLQGRVLDIAYDPMRGAKVEVRRRSGGLVAQTTTGPDGAFFVARKVLDALQPREDLEVRARSGDATAVRLIPESDLYFEPVRYRPIPTRVAGQGNSTLSLNGVWRICTEAPEKARRLPLDDGSWHAIRVPGQWLQQGYDIPQDRPVSMVRAFTVPKSWTRCRTFLRFDAIHAGVTYWLNGKLLGRSENLFTPVEWEVTDALLPGRPNRLDLEMVVDTPSERLSYASGYAFHSLGGIDRSVHLYALPRTCIRSVHLAADLDREYRDGTLSVRASVDNPEPGVSLHIALTGPDGKPVAHSAPEVAVSSAGSAEAVCGVANPLKWSAEKPHLYRVSLELRRGAELLERVERNVGFRKVEVRGSQLYVNGRRIKVAGACHHEIDPLTGRANTMRHAWTDVRLMKAANLNYIRTSHYPPCQELLDAADRLGMYVEVEAPFCWVGEVDSLKDLRAVLTPTSAMVDYDHAHPSVIVWSLANESAFNRLFEVSHRLVKDLDPTRPTTFNNPDPKRICEIANLHYPPMPFDKQLEGDPRPIYLGEYAFPVCHEQTDVRIDPGLRELWGHGSADPASAWGRFCAAGYDPAYMRPGMQPGEWSYIVRSERVIGGSIWAALDEPFYFKDGKRAGYAWVHGFWGLIDAWRRPKPEWGMARHIFCPVWFPERVVPFEPGQKLVRIPVENRYAFTDLSELRLTWRIGGRRGRAHAQVGPGATGVIAIPVPPGARPGDPIVLRIASSTGALIDERALTLGADPVAALPAPKAGPPACSQKDGVDTIAGNGWSLAFDRRIGQFVGAGAPVPGFPSPHVTQYDFGDLGGPLARPYAVYPDPGTRVVESATVDSQPAGAAIVVRDRYARFEGTTRWLIDRKGMGRIAYDYVYTGPDMSAREIGMRLLLPADRDTLSWKRWTEWGAFPADSICRSEGAARARRDPSIVADPEGVPPSWPWSQDQTELGAADFRSIKFNVYQASLLSSGGSGIRVYANADAHVRACLDPSGVLLHVLSRCSTGPAILKTGDHVRGEVVVQLVSPPSP